MKNKTLSPSQLEAYHSIASAYKSQEKSDKYQKTNKVITFVLMAVIVPIGIICGTVGVYFVADKQAGTWDTTHCNASGQRDSVKIPARYDGDYTAYMKDHGQEVSKGGYCGY